VFFFRAATDAREAGRDPGDRPAGLVHSNEKTGQWDIACSQLCGLGHYRMKGVYQIQTAEDYQAWLKEESSFQ
jgi:heme/copper-type cytochrome/quinol oxidase subunit 2